MNETELETWQLWRKNLLEKVEAEVEVKVWKTWHATAEVPTRFYQLFLPKNTGKTKHEMIVHYANEAINALTAFLVGRYPLGGADAIRLARKIIEEADDTFNYTQF